MSDRARKISELSVLTDPVSNDYVVVLDSSAASSEATKKLSIGSLLGNSSANIVIQNQTPASGSITIKQGTLLYDNTYLYIAVSNNNIKKIPLSNF